MKSIKTYTQAIDYLYNICPPFHQVGAKAYKPGLETIRQLMASLSNPQDQYPTVHIAGTNGKGSTSHLIAAALQSAGLKVGLYTSPHLVDFRERIRVNGQMIPEARVTRFVSDYSSFLSPSFFELTTALAFTFFAEQQVDIAVIETGLGGRLDATNIITPLVSIITNIGLDHTEFLGHTLAAIASEKAGIIKPGVPCVIGETQAETAPVFQRFFDAASGSSDPSDNSPSKIEGEAVGRGRMLYPSHSSADSPMGASELSLPLRESRRGSSLFFADQCEYMRRCRLREAPDCELTGPYQDRNLQTAYVALRVLRDTFPALDARAIREGFAHVSSLTGLRGRWETLSQTPLTICDTGHNSHGIRTYVTRLRELAKGDSHLRIVFGMVADKDVDTVLSLLPKEAYYYWCQAATQRAIPADELCQKGLAHGLIGLNYGPVDVALRAAQKDAAPEDVIFIGGSNYVVGEALRVRI